MALTRGSNGLPSIEEYDRSALVSTSIATRLSDIGAARFDFMRLHDVVDDRQAGLIDSIILTLLEDYARLDSDPDSVS